MTDSKHTPGPWHATGTGLVRPQGMDFGSLKLGSGWIEGAWSGADADEETLANARLVAAAPDLLQMLKAAQLWLDVEGRFDMQGINAAIAKAEGKA